MAISEFPITIPYSKNPLLRDWNPLQELRNPFSHEAPTILIYGDSDTAHSAAAELIARLISQLPNMALFVIPETPENAEGEIDKTTEVMTWLSDTKNRVARPDLFNEDTPIPVMYLSSVVDLYSETKLWRLVNRAKFHGLAVIAVATNVDPESVMFSNVTGMFTHTVKV